jgi:hypothetical protein
MTNQKFMEYLEIAYKISAVIGVLILIWYTIETYKIRNNSDRQLAYSARPYLGFIADPNPYTVSNKSNNVALNIFQFSKISGQFFIADETSVGSALAPQSSIHFDKNSNKQISKSEMIRRMPDLKKLVDFIDKKETNSFVVVYEDLLGNKLFTSIYGSGDNFDVASESKYINDLK